MKLGYSFQGPRRGADRAVLLAHGAGSDRQAPALRSVATALKDAGVPTLRFDYPYRVAGRKAPDSQKVLRAATREAAESLARRTALPPERLVLGGRSMGGRYTSLIVGDEEDPVPALGLLLLGYPLHAAGKPEKQRADHFGRLDLPVLFASGTRDSLTGRADLTRAAKKIPGSVEFLWLDSADHGFRPLKSSGRTIDDVNVEVAAASVRWVRSL